jgi:hypothetical protein
MKRRFPLLQVLLIAGGAAAGAAIGGHAWFMAISNDEQFRMFNVIRNTAAGASVGATAAYGWAKRIDRQELDEAIDRYRQAEEDIFIYLSAQLTRSDLDPEELATLHRLKDEKIQQLRHSRQSGTVPQSPTDP